jgi:putative FmdB family regulatory protein
MPVYEFYCPDCHTIFSFFSRRVDTDTRPTCPRCGRPELGRQASLFAIGKRRTAADEGDAGSDLPAGVDEERMMQAFASMAGEMEGLDDSDPRQAARVMRRLFDAAGLKPGDGMVEAIRRMEAGEDPDTIEAELGDALEGEDPVAGARPAGSTRDLLRRLRRDLLPVARDDGWYPLKSPQGEPDPGSG